MNGTDDSKTGFSLYPWQEANWQTLVRYIESERVPHALMIAGPDGVGKLRLAMCFANHLLCNGPKAADFRCGHCASCRLVDAGTHPDLIRIEPPEPGKPITIDRIRDLTDTLSLTAQYNQYRIVIIRPADRMNSAAGNAFLKTLEEPGSGTVMMLLTARPRDLPATIKSRCQRLNVRIPDPDLAKDWLEQRVRPEESGALLAMAAGAPLKALAMGVAGNLERRNSVFTWWCEIAGHQAEPVRIAEKLSPLPLREVLVWITGWTMDLIRLRMVPMVKLLGNPDLREVLQTEAKKLELQPLFRFYDGLIQIASMIDTPVNVQLQLESILIDWYSLKRSL